MNSETSRNFLVRTDALAHRMGINVQDLPDVLGIGRASLFCCRAGKRTITPKTWLKLEAAEKEAGISEVVVREGNPKESQELSAEKIAGDAALFPDASPEELDAARRDLSKIESALIPHREFQTKMAALQEAAMNSMFAALRIQMKSINAWPPMGEDDSLSFTQLWAKYVRK